MLALLLANAAWRGRYERVLQIHLDVLGALAAKTAAAVELGVALSPNHLTELSYPLERARGFVAEQAARSDEESYRRFVSVVDEYAALVGEIDAARGDEERWKAFRPGFAARHARLRQLIDGVRQVLR